MVLLNSRTNQPPSPDPEDVAALSRANLHTDAEVAEASLPGKQHGNLRGSFVFHI